MAESRIESMFALHCRAEKLAPVREYKFHPTRKWRFDFAFPDRMIAVECEGGVWTNGRHTRGSGYIADLDKYNEAQRLGWSIFRFHGGAVMSGEAIRFVKAVLQQESI